MNPVTDALAFLLSTVLLGCAADDSATAPSASPPLRVGHTYNHGNCALDSDNKLTGLCQRKDRTGKGCMEHAPAPDSPPCKPVLAATETKAAVCSSGNSAQVMVSREYQCFWLDE